MQFAINAIQKSFGSKHVLKNITFTFEQGKIYGLLGRNGAGKTTLFNCISGEENCDGGSAFILENGQKRQITPSDVGYVFSTPILPDFLTGYEFVKFYIDINRDRANPQNSINDYFDLMQIENDDRHRLIKGYSHGMKNKLQMLCFIISRPSVILLDEPLTSLDVVVALEMKKLLRQMKDNHVIIFSTHILQLATDLCDEIVLLNNGYLEQVDHKYIGSRQLEDEIVNLLNDKDDENE